VQIVAGLYPDMNQFDPRGANEAGFPWEKDYARIRPEYFDAADARLKCLVDVGISPCIVGAWGSYMEFMGVEKVRKHWRYLIARYGAMPVTWCAAGEANLPWYLVKGFPYDDRPQVTKWTEVMRYIRATDPFHRPLTIHPTGLGRLSARHATDDSNLLDFDMLQTPHGERGAIEPTVRTARESYRDTPVMPVIDGEAAYEMLMDRIPTEWTRRMFWLCMTSGAAGHTYGANGIWQCNRRGEPHGPSPHMGPGNGYGAVPWDEAMNFAGSTQMGIGKKFFERFEWWKFEPNVEWARWAGDENVKWGDWIWAKDVADAQVDAPVGKVKFRKTFARPANGATIYVTADDGFEVLVNGKRVGSSDGEADSWRRVQKIDLAPALRDGQNVFEIVAENVASNVAKNPAGVICGGAVVTDETWEGAKVVAKYGDAPWGRVGETSAKMPITAAGIADRVRVIYVPEASAIELHDLGEAKWQAIQFDPVTGEEREVKLEECGKAPAWGHDWVLILQKN
jgi:hypothetical protein